MKIPDWHDDRVCTTGDPRLFDVVDADERAEHPGVRIEKLPRVRAAMRLCAGCPVRKLCDAEMRTQTDHAPMGIRAGWYISAAKGAQLLAAARQRVGA